LPKLLAEKPGEVLWLNGGIEAWQLAHRPNWAITMQGASTVYSRPLTVKWDARVQQLIALGLEDASIRAPFTEPVPTSLPSLPSMAKVQALCGSADAPAWIVAPMARGGAWPADLSAIIWQAPAPSYHLSVENGQAVWQRLEAYALIRCAG
jgi:hypothetical protein